MNDEDKHGETSEPAPIYLVSGGLGTSGELLVETVLAQFPGVRVPLVKRPRVWTTDAAEQILELASSTGGTIVHTLVARRIRELVNREAKARHIPSIDLVGPLLQRVSQLSRHEPEGRPGLYRERRHAYFQRIDAIEFTVSHDDGRRPEDLALSDIVLLGVSRCGKTPLSMYLAVQGWKVANIPLVAELPPPRELQEVDQHRVIGLTIDYDNLIVHRKMRAERLGEIGPSTYAQPTAVHDELMSAGELYRTCGFHVINVTGKPIETLAEEVLDSLPHPHGGPRVD
jgi:regulator of PEP synthase PpsR (kinase-PPPase family)